MLALIGLRFLEEIPDIEVRPLDNFGTTNSDAMKFCTELVHH